jgi:hypothetical protein
VHTEGMTERTGVEQKDGMEKRRVVKERRRSAGRDAEADAEEGDTGEMDGR